MTIDAEQSPLQIISEITEFNEISDYMQDDQLDRAMALTIKILTEKGRMPQERLPAIIAELQALATVFALKATFYMTVGKGGSEESKKKNVYYTAKDSITKLVDALKFAARQ